MENTTIEWADHTFNPWVGCTQVSPGCRNCYALTLNKRWAGGKNWGKGAPRKRTSDANWKQPLKWNRDVWAQCPTCGVKQPHGSVCIVPGCLTVGSEMQRHRPRVFCASLADWLDDEVPIEWLADLLKLIHDTPNLDWLLLTKRPENFNSRLTSVLKYLEDKGDNQEEFDLWIWVLDWIATDTRQKTPANVWIGTTVENQAMADQRIPLLLSIPAKVRFLSCEPLLGPLCFGKGTYFRDANREPEGGLYGSMLSVLDWVICGGESGPGARPMHPDWARSLRDQCQAASVPFFFKQWGEYVPLHALEVEERNEMVIDANGTDITGDFARQDHTGARMFRVGKRFAGRLLDGREWNEFPKAEVPA